jgi:hypothetical protein
LPSNPLWILEWMEGEIPELLILLHLWWYCMRFRPGSAFLRMRTPQPRVDKESSRMRNRHSLENSSFRRT